ncbi:hypothetical protein, partial [Pontibacter aydingkolensis]
MTDDLTVPDSATTLNLADLYTNLSPYLREIGIGELHLNNSSFSYGQKDKDSHIIHSLEKVNIDLKALQIDSATLFTPTEKSFAAAIAISTENYTYSPLTNPYTLTVGKMKLSTRDKTLQADALHLSGDWGKNDKLIKQGKAERTLYDINLPHLRFRDLDLLQLYGQVSGVVNKLEVGEVRITDAAITHTVKPTRLIYCSSFITPRLNLLLLTTGFKKGNFLQTVNFGLYEQMCIRCILSRW